MSLRGIKQGKACYLIIALVVLLPVAGFSQVTVSDFTVLDWFKMVKLSWKVTAPEGSDGMFQIYRSATEEGPYVLVQEIQLGDKQFFDVITKSYVFYDKKLEVGRSYYYKLTVRGADEVFGPLRGLASGSPPGT
ncbi:MAG: hypothetical protein ACETWD_02725 [Desulfatiglandales bacterium]|jgi:hypothetical protein